MHLISQLVIASVALAHLGFMLLEMLLWDKPLGLRTFGTTQNFARQSRALAANQGLYNGFLAVGLLWSLWPIGAPQSASAIATFFLSCVVIAGLFGAATVSRRILYVQAAPALVALMLIWVWPGTSMPV